MTEAGAPPHTSPSPDAAPGAGTATLVRRGRAALSGMLIATAIIVVVAVVAAMRDTPPTIVEGRDTPPPAAGPPAPAAPTGRPPGRCLTWDQSAGTPPDAGAAATVPCDEPHLVEVTGQVTVTEELPPEPTAEELDAVVERLCRPRHEAHLGGPLDPEGRYYAANYRPSPESWRAGAREVWCALGARDGTEDPFAEGDGRHRPFRGAVSAAGQFWLYEAGDCLAPGRRGPVPCAAPHEVEVVGRIELPDGPPPPEPGDTAGWRALLADTCGSQARGFLDREPQAPLTAGWLPIERASWLAGQRTAHCVIGTRAASGDWVTVTGSARASTGD